MFLYFYLQPKDTRIYSPTDMRGVSEQFFFFLALNITLFAEER